MKNLKIKETYLLFLIVMGLISLAIYSTYALFTASSEIDDVVNFTASLTTESSILEYEMVTIPAGETKIIEVNVTNSYTSTIYYGAWYEMVSPTEKTDDIEIGVYTEENNTPGSGEISSGSVVNLLVGINNLTSSDVIINIGVAGSETSNLNLSERRIILSDGWSLPKDLKITNITLDNNIYQGIPTSGNYTLTSSCNNVSFDKVSKTVKIDNFTKNTACDLNFKTSTDTSDYPLLNTMKVGDYVAYVGNNGCLNGASGTTGTSTAEAGNSCKGENANQSIDTNGTYGYCYSSSYRFYVYGWRIAYIENGNVYLISAGSPECRTRTASAGNATQIADLNNAALKYCNATYADGESCSSSNTWAMGNEDFKKITYAISGTSSNLTTDYGSPYCYNTYSKTSCGYGNDLIDNGGYYWFAAYYSSTDTSGVYWYPPGRRVLYSSGTHAYGFRPIIRLSSSVYVTGGSGTMEEPYEIGV